MSRALETRNKERVEGKPVVVCHVSIISKSAKSLPWVGGLCKGSQAC
jgi:hypothetical protein